MKLLYSRIRRQARHGLSDYLLATGAVLITTGLAFLFHRLVPGASLSLLFLTSVVIVSSRTGLGPSLLASVLSFLAFTFFFISPHYTFKVADQQDLTTLIFFLVMATITGNLAARMRGEIANRQVSLRRMSILYEFGRSLSSATTSQQVLRALAQHMAHSLECLVEVYLPDADGQPELFCAAGEAEKSSDDSDAGALSAAWLQREDALLSLDPVHYLSLTSQQETLGLVVLHKRQASTDHLQLARILCDIGVGALDRIRLESDLQKERVISETEQLRSALLSSVSHDLRTPLASIIGSATSLLEYGSTFSEENRTELLATVLDEAQRLDRHIQNLLDMTRLGQGSVNLRRDWVDCNDIIASAVSRLRDVLKGWPLDISVEPDLPMLWVHGVFIEQALVNLLDNAVRFSPPGGRIGISARRNGERLEISLCDDGPGIPDGEKEKVFDMFYTSQQGDRSNRRGTGLGLAICRGMISAHQGTVSAHDGPGGRGTCMRILLPVVEPHEEAAQ